MKMFVYSIYDTASGVYMRPFFMQSDGQAIRSFSDISCDAEHEIGKHPEDYSLFRLGTFDDNKGKLQGDAPDCIVTALECVAKTRAVAKDKQEELLRSVK